MFSTHDEEKSVVAERFIRTLKNKICKRLTLIPTNVYIDKLDYIVDKCINTYRKTTKMKSTDVNTSTFMDFVI